MGLILLGALCLAGAAYVFLDALTVKQKQIAGSLQRARRYGGTVSIRESELTRDVSERILAPVIHRLARIATALPMTQSPDEIRRRLNAAGLGQTLTPTAWLAIKAGVGLLGGLFVFFLTTAGALPPFAVIFAPIAAFMLFLIPDTVLGFRVSGRREDMLVQLPDVLDLLCVSVEAGLGFDAALIRIVERTKGPLVDEMAIVLHEMRIGETRQQALKSFSERLDMQETTSFARSIIQADQMGMSLGRILRAQSFDARNKRQMAAEEKAMKAPIKMLFPTVLFIFPAMFIVILGPAMITLVNQFSSI